MGGLQPRLVRRPVEAHHGIYTTLGTDSRLVLVVAIAPLCDGAGRECAKAVVAGSKLTAEKRVTMQR